MTICNINRINCQNLFLTRSELADNASMAEELDVIGNLPFMRVVEEDERVEMTMVFATCRELAVTVTPGIGAVILLFFPLEALFVFWGLLFLAVGTIVMKLPRHVD